MNNFGFGAATSFGGAAGGGFGAKVKCVAHFIYYL